MASDRHDPGAKAAAAAAAANPAPAAAAPHQPSACGFVVICPPKAISFGADHEFHRDLHERELQRELAFEVDDPAQRVKSTIAVLPGGGARVLGDASASATTSLFVDAGGDAPPNGGGGGSGGGGAAAAAADRPQQHALPAEQEAAHGLFAVFKGILTNRAALAASAGVSLGGGDASDGGGGGNGGSGNSGSSNAALIVRLYQKHGIHLLGRLEGSWSFCLFDAHQGRVLAARAPCGGVPLFEGKTPGGALVICCGAFLPPGCSDVHAIAPGCAKWGWSSAPRPYSPGVAQQREGRRPAGDRTILRRSTELPQGPAAGGGGGSSGGGGAAAAAASGGSGGGAAAGAAAGGADPTYARRWSEVSAASSMGPDEVAAAAAPPIPRHALHADAPAYVPPRRSSETGAAAAAASWRSAGGGGSQRSSRRSSFDHQGGRPSYEHQHQHHHHGGGGGGSRSSQEQWGSGRASHERRGGGSGSARPSGEGRPPPSAAARRGSADGQAQAQPTPLAAATAAMGALKC